MHSDYSPNGCGWMLLKLGAMLAESEAAQKDAYNAGDERGVDLHHEATMALRTAINCIEIVRKNLRKLEKPACEPNGFGSSGPDLLPPGAIPLHQQQRLFGVDDGR